MHQRGILRQVVLTTILLVLMAVAHGEQANSDNTTTPAPAAAPTPTVPTDDRATITRGKDRLKAHTITSDLSDPDITAEGDLELTVPQGVFKADKGHYNLKTQAGELEKAKGTFAPLRFYADKLTMDPKTKRLHNARLTTCDNEAHPHYQLIVRDYVLYTQDNRYVARHLTMEIAGHKIFTVPSLSGQLAEKDGKAATPGVSAGTSHLDGTYVAFAHQMPLGSHDDLRMQGRYGTEGLLRGGLFLDHRFSLPGPLPGGIFTLVASQREDVANRLLSSRDASNETLRDLTISRQPAAQLTFNPIMLPGPLHGCTVQLAGGFGHFSEQPTGVEQNRAQVWGILKSPSYHLGPFRLYGQFGLRDTQYEDSTYHTTIGEIGLETKPTASTYLNLAVLHRNGTGYSPFLFDRVEIPSELFSEFEFPFTRNGLWRLGVWHRLDLSNGLTRDYNVTAIYHMDCISYGLYYNRATQSVGLGLVLNAFGSFRRPSPGVGFTQ